MIEELLVLLNMTLYLINCRYNQFRLDIMSNPTQNPTTGPPPFRVMCCGNMTASHCWRLLNTFYRYEVDLVWVWSGWEVLIISYSMSPVRRTPLRILRLAHSFLEWWYSMVLWQYGCQPWLKAFKHFLYVWSGSGVSMKWILDLTLSWWCGLYPVRRKRPGQAVTYYGQIMYP